MPTMRAPAVITVTLAVLLSSCGTTNDPGQPAGPGSGAGSATTQLDTGKFRDKNLLIGVTCSPPNFVSVYGWDPGTWNLEARAEFRLPPNTVTDDARRTNGKSPKTVLANLCNWADKLKSPSTDWVDAPETAARSLFDKNFTRMAITFEDREKDAAYVGWSDRAGNAKNLTVTGSGSEFADTPREENAAISQDGETVLFTSTSTSRSSLKSTVNSRSVSGDHKAVEYGKADRMRPITVIGKYFDNSDEGYFSPDGTKIYTGGAVLPKPAQPGYLGEMKSTVKDDGCPGDVKGWIDNDTVLCSGSGFFAQVRPGVTDHQTVKPVEILPETDRHNVAMVVSPDGQRTLFLSKQNTATDLYITDNKAGSTPVKVERNGSLQTAGEGVWFIEWR